MRSLTRHRAQLVTPSLLSSNTGPGVARTHAKSRVSCHFVQRLTMATSAAIATVGSSEKTWHPHRPRCFAPLDVMKSKAGDESLTPLRGIIFDVDGTLCLPQNYMFREMRTVLGIEKPVDILDHIRSLSTDPDDSTSASSPQSRAQDAIRAIEQNAMTSQRPQPGLHELMMFLEARHVPKALCTRNFHLPVQHLIDTFLGDLKEGFGMIITREAKGIAPKPSPEGLWAIARSWGLDQVSKDDDVVKSQRESIEQGDLLELARKQLGTGIIMVGDSIDDMAAGYRAGAATVLLVNDENISLAEHEYVDLSIRRLDELMHILDNGFVGRS